jgi:glycosyltransferase involved in cell wall biosynthesis
MRTVYHALSTSETSGEGRPASAILAALRVAGFDVSVVEDAEGEELRSVSPRPPRRPEDDQRLATELEQRFRQRPPGDRPELWMTEGVGPVAPDGVGPRISSALGIPYVVAEPALPSAAAGQDVDGFLSRLDPADAVVTTSSAVAEALGPLLAERCRLIRLLPFLDVAPYRDAARIRDHHRSLLSNRLHLPDGSPWLLTVAAMEGKGALESFQMLARALSRIPALDWHLVVVGDGADHEDVQAALLVLPHHRVRMLGSVAPGDVPAILVCCDLFIWPALGDAGLHRLLEAQAAGLPVVASASTRVRDRVLDGQTGRVAAAANAESFANAVSFLLRNPAFRTSMAQEARAVMVAEHDIHVAARTLAAALPALAR